MALDWTNKINNVDNVDANDVNTLAAAIKDVEQSVTTEDGKLTDHKTKTVLDHPDSSVTTNKIANGAVSTDKIAPSAVTGSRIANNAVTDTKIADGAVTTSKIGKNAVGTDNIKDAAVDSAKIVNGSIAARHIIDGQVTRDKIAADSISSDKLANKSVTTEKINDGAVTTEKIEDNAITTSKIADGEISEAKLDTALSEKINGKANSSDVYTKAEADTKLGAKENIANKVTEISDTSTDVQYPSAKAVNDVVSAQKTDVVQNYANALKGKVSGNNAVRIDDSSPIEHEMNVRVSSKNLIDLSLIPTEETVEYGITYKYLPDEQCILLNGTTTVGDIAIMKKIAQHGHKMPAGIDYTYSLRKISGTISKAVALEMAEDTKKSAYLTYENFLAVDASNTSKTAKNTATVSVGTFYLYAPVAGTVFDNCKIQAQLERGTTATEYTPYVDVSTVTLTQRGKNLIPYNRRNKSDRGIDFTVNDDGSVTANGTATNISQFFHAVGTVYNVPNGKVYTLSDPTTDSETTYQTRGQTLKPDGSGGFTFLCTKAKPYYTWSDEQAATIRTGVFIKSQVSSGITVSNLKFYPQFELGDAATKYESPLPEITYSVPEDGIVTGIKNIYPTTTLLSKKDNVVIDVEYNRDINKAFEELQNAILAQGSNT